MAEQAQARVQDAVNSMINQLDKSVLRKMQRDMHNCSAKCCDDTRGRMDDVQRCVEICSQPVLQAQNYVQSELTNFQERLQRCAMQCQDEIRDKVSPGGQVSHYREEFEGCLITCVDSHINMLPILQKRIEETIRSNRT